MKCSNCQEGRMIEGSVENYDATDLIGFNEVVVASAPAWVCNRCGHIMFEGTVIDTINQQLARLIIRHIEELRPAEARFLREMMGMTQAELAERLGISRATINRWEMGDDRIGAVQSLALRTLAAWSLEDPALAREIGAPARSAPAARKTPPYRVETGAA